MPETIIVAIITFATGVFGASIGAIVTCRTTKFSLQEEHTKILRDEKKKCYLSFMDTYNSFASYLAYIETHQEDEVSSDKEIDLYKQFQYSCMAVNLVASDSVVAALQEVHIAMNHYGQTHVLPRNINQLYTALVNEMRKDLNLLNKHRAP